MVHRPMAHAAEARWCACLVSPLATSALATSTNTRACSYGMVMERATVSGCSCRPASASAPATTVSARACPSGLVMERATVARGMREETAATSLGEVFGLGSCDEDDLYAAMDWLAARQDEIQDALAARHLAGGTLVLYDVSSAAFEGRTCPLGAIGHPKTGCTAGCRSSTGC